MMQPRSGSKVAFFLRCGTAIAAIATFGVLAAGTPAGADPPSSATVSPPSATLASTGNTLVFTFTAGSTITDGEITLDVPTGWSPPSVTGSQPGYVTNTCGGTVGVIGLEIDITGVTLGGGTMCTITYGDTTSGGPGATVPNAGGSATFDMSNSTTSGGTLVDLPTSPTVTLNTTFVHITVSGSQVYGSSNPTFTAAPAAPLPSGTYLTGSVTCPEIFGGFIDPTLGVGGSPYMIDGLTCSGLNLASLNGSPTGPAAAYTLVLDGGNFTVSQASYSVTISGSQAYNGTPNFTITPDYGPGGPSDPLVNSGLTCSGVQLNGLSPDMPLDATTPLGAYLVDGSTCSNLTLGSPDDTNYTFTLRSGAFTVTPATFDVAVSGTMTYGDNSSIDISPSPSSGPTEPFSGKLTCTTVNGGTAISGPPYLNADTANSIDPASCGGLSLTGSDATNYTIVYTSNPLDFTVSQAVWNITPNGSQTYGGGDETFTPDPSSGPTEDYTGTLSCTSWYIFSFPSPGPVPIESGLGAGSYPVLGPTCGGLSLQGEDANNYNLNYEDDGTFTVNPEPITITASDAISQYGSGDVFPDSLPDCSVTSGALESSDSLSDLGVSFETDIASDSDVGDGYETDCTDDDANYDFTIVDGTGTVTPAPLTITASDEPMTYGGPVPEITPSYSDAGLVNNDSTESLGVTCGTRATDSSPVSGSPYTSYCQDTDNSDDANYSITFDDGSVTMSQAPLTVTAPSLAMNYGTATPVVTPEYSGLVNDETATNPPAHCVTTGSPTKPAGVYPGADTCTDTDPNYAVTLVSGTLTVNKTPVLVNVTGSEVRYSGASFSSTPGTGPTGPITGSVSCTTVDGGVPITKTLADGSYALDGGNCSGLSLSAADAVNYVLEYVGGTFTVTPTPHGYWLVGSDGGVFSFGSAQFHGSTGNLTLNRPVVGITPTTDEGGYWLVATDGGLFAFGDAGYFGSIPGLGLAPAGSPASTRHLNAPIVAMVPSADGGGYFMVGSDGGVFAFGDAIYEGSCPGIGGCSGTAVGVAPDASGHGYWLVTSTGNVYAFGDAHNDGSPGQQTSTITSIVRTPDGGGYYIIDANGAVFTYGDAQYQGGLVYGDAGGTDPAAAIFTTSDGNGYWIVSAFGKEYPFGDAPDYGGLENLQLNGLIIAATGF